MTPAEIAGHTPGETAVACEKGDGTALAAEKGRGRMRALSTTAELNAATGWTAKQRNHLRRLIKSGATICYWCSDAQGRPAKP